MPFTPTSHPNTTIHHFAPRLIALEHPPSTPTPPRNTLIWIGGLSDGLLTVSYPTLLAANLPAGWALAQPLLSSSYTGWGTSDLRRDVKELSQLVGYLRGIRTDAEGAGKIVLMGHSTGAQDCVLYVAGAGAGGRERVDGVVLQAAVSDADGLRDDMSAEELEASVRVARELVRQGRGRDVLPSAMTAELFGRAPVCALRFLSLASPEGDGEDDMFSAGASDERVRAVFGGWTKGVPLCVLNSGADEHVPEGMDKRAVMERWASVVREAGGVVDEVGVVEGAYHNLEDNTEEVRMRLVDRVKSFIEKVDRGSCSEDADAKL